MEQKKVLIVEDTISILNELREILTFEGFEVSRALNGQEGIEQAKKILPDLILSDIMMPVKNGYEFFDELQHDPATSHIPFIFLSAKASKESQRYGMILGADDYITKPFDIDLLIQSVNSRIAKAEKLKGKFNATVNNLQQSITRAIPHELLTPLNGILGFSSILMEVGNEIPKEEFLEFTTCIHESAERLHKTIKKFIYYTEIELLISKEVKAKALLEEKTKMAGFVLDGLCDTLGAQLNRSDDFELNVTDFDLKIMHSHYEIILSELLDNALKFSKKGDKIKVDVTVASKEVIITIKDNGIGMTSEDINEITALLQFNRNSFEQQGLGLGLMIAKKLIEFYGGTLNIKSEKGKGTEVEIKLNLV